MLVFTSALYKKKKQIKRTVKLFIPNTQRIPSLELRHDRYAPTGLFLLPYTGEEIKNHQIIKLNCNVFYEIGQYPHIEVYKFHLFSYYGVY